MRRKKRIFPVWIPWAIAAFSAVSGVAFNLVDRLMTAARIEGRLEVMSKQLEWLNAAMSDLVIAYGKDLRKRQEE